MKIRLYLIICAAVVGVISCKRNPFVEQQLIAQVGDERLYVSDVSSIFSAPLTPQDSLQLLEQYVDAWVMRQLKMAQASRLFRDDEPEIESMIEDYRASLLTLRLDEYFVEERADTTLTDSELSDYYEAHKGEFALDRSLVKGVVVRLPANHSRLRQVRELMSGGNERQQDFLELSQKNGFDVQEVTEWMDFDDFLRLLPTNNRRDYDDMLSTGGVQEMRDGADMYLILVRSAIRRGGTMPLEMVRDDIRRVIMNQRRTDVIRGYEDSLRKVAIEKNELKLNFKE